MEFAQKDLQFTPASTSYMRPKRAGIFRVVPTAPLASLCLPPCSPYLLLPLRADTPAVLPHHVLHAQLPQKLRGLTQGRWGRGPGSVQDVPGQLASQVEQKRSAHMVQKEGVLRATGRMAQDEASYEPGGRGPSREGVRSLSAIHNLLCTPS